MALTIVSWNTARLIALILNALTGLQHYYNKELDIINADGIFALKILEGFCVLEVL